MASALLSSLWIALLVRAAYAGPSGEEEAAIMPRAEAAPKLQGLNVYEDYMAHHGIEVYARNEVPHKQKETEIHEDDVALAEDHENEAEEETPAAETAAFMLVGSITFVMSIFYIVNCYDEDMRRYAWNTIGNTLAIFTAVLFYKACHGVIHSYITDYLRMHLFVDFMHMGFWFTALHFISGLLTTSWKPDINIDPEMMASPEVKQLRAQLLEPEKSARDLNIRCFCGMLSHITGFAAVDAFGDLQHSWPFSTSPVGALLIVPVVFASMRLMFWVTNYQRHDEIAKKHEDQLTEVDILWDETAEDAENDVLGLCCSFLTIQGIRFHISGTLPSNEGELSHEEDLPVRQLVVLMCFVCFWGVAAIGSVLFYQMRLKQNDHFRRVNTRRLASRNLSEWDIFSDPIGYIRSIEFIKRTHLLTQSYFNMCFAWSLLFVGKESVLAAQLFQEDKDINNRIILAVVMSVVVFMLIFLLDKLVDADMTGEDLDVALIRIIASKGLAIGFAWEQAFDSSVEVISAPGSRVDYLRKLFLATFVCLIVVPAYRLYILPNIVEANEGSKATLDQPSESVEPRRLYDRLIE